MIICLCLLLSGDIHLCPGPTGQTTDLPDAPTCDSGAFPAAVLLGGVPRDPALAQVNPSIELRWTSEVSSCADGGLDLRRDSSGRQQFTSAESTSAAGVVNPELGGASVRRLSPDGPGFTVVCWVDILQRRERLTWI